MIVLAFNKALSRDAMQHIAERFKQAKKSDEVIVVGECTVLSDDPAVNTSTIQFSDGSVTFVPHGISKRSLLDALWRQAEDGTCDPSSNHPPMRAQPSI